MHIENNGIVYLVGAGPGAPDLITMRGLDRLRRADVILYDRLVSPELLEEAPARAERIFVGKGPGEHSLPQEEINALMIERAEAGQVVVRLKGGDPFVFARGGEEAEACQRAGVSWEVVPGVSSAIGVPEIIGIPITQRGVSSAFAVVTGHRAGDADDDLDWGALAKIDTLVVLMGVGRLEHIVTCLMGHGRNATTPVAIMERGSLPGERVIVGTLESISGDAQRDRVSPPAVIVIGEVVGLREMLHKTSPEQIGLDYYRLPLPLRQVLVRESQV